MARILVLTFISPIYSIPLPNNHRDGERMTLLEKSEIKERVNVAWERVFHISGHVLRHANTFGFHLMDQIPDPNIHHMLGFLRVIDELMGVMIEYDEFSAMDYDDTRRILNARQQVRLMENVAVALKRDDELGFEVALAELERQAPF